MKLGHLEKVNNLRDIWHDEARDFTPWLAKQENIDVLSSTLGINIKVIDTEVYVGKYHLDILAINEDTNETIIIENQLEATDHDHLGKLFVYGAGYNAKTIIWIVKDVNDEHRQAVEWINEHTDKDVNIILVKIELYKINDSLPAPHFDIVSLPNDWTKTIRSSTNRELTDVQLKYLNFWQGFINYCKDNDAPFSSYRKANDTNFYEISFGVSGAQIDLVADKSGNISCGIYIKNDQELFNKYRDNKEFIESELNCQLVWDYIDDRASNSVRKVCEFKLDFSETDFNVVYEWLLNNAIQFKKVFSSI